MMYGFQDVCMLPSTTDLFTTIVHFAAFLLVNVMYMIVREYIHLVLGRKTEAGGAYSRDSV